LQKKFALAISEYEMQIAELIGCHWVFNLQPAILNLQ